MRRFELAVLVDSDPVPGRLSFVLGDLPAYLGFKVPIEFKFINLKITEKVWVQNNIPAVFE